MNQTPLAMSPDGQTVVFMQQGQDIWTLSLAGDRKPRPFVTTPFRESGGAVSPDGAWLAYASDESGRNEVFAQAFPGGGPKIQISRAGGTDPHWSRSGEIFYRQGTKMIAVRATTTPTLTVGEPQTLFDGGQYGPSNFSYDVTADGQRFLMIRDDPGASSSSAHIDLVLNWTREQSRLVGSK